MGLSRESIRGGHITVYANKDKETKKTYMLCILTENYKVGEPWIIDSDRLGENVV
ncbi:hypothetical protein WKV44_05815 [Spirochaetia bacterium 38H-sp]|uniref:Uncharacterized protein n=1 Tax=Rarispira pelagica TaxID=3141764 RepID=A0ABU9UBK8_9SPIR